MNSNVPRYHSTRCADNRLLFGGFTSAGPTILMVSFLVMKVFAAVLLVGHAGTKFLAADAEPITVDAHEPVERTERVSTACLSSGDEQSCDNPGEKDERKCTLYLAPSSIPGAGLGIFTAEELPMGALIGASDDLGEKVIPVLDQYKTLPFRGQQRWLPWLSYIWGAANFVNNEWNGQHGFNEIQHDGGLYKADGLSFNDGMGVWEENAFVPGLASLMNSHPELVNVGKSDSNTSVGSAEQGVSFTAIRPIKAGSELFINYGRQWHARKNKNTGNNIDWHERRNQHVLVTTEEDAQVELELLEEHGACIDALRVGSVMKKNDSGRGAFVTRFFSKGSVITTTPLLVLKRDDLTIYEVDESQNYKKNVLKKNNIIGRELLLNYCYGSPNSELLLLPTAPGVNYINHDSQKPNAEIRWSEKMSLFPASELQKWRQLHPLDVLEMGSGKLVMEFIATRDIQHGEEILINYGRKWEEAFQKYLDGESTRGEEERCITATEYLSKQPKEDGENPTIRTISEQEERPYPAHLQTMCFFYLEDVENGCLRPCTVVEREWHDGALWYHSYYSWEEHLEDAERLSLNQKCGLGESDVNEEDGYEYWEWLPAGSVTLVERWKSPLERITEGATEFRHEIGVPDGFFPSIWNEEPVYKLAPLTAPLKPGDFELMRFAHNGKVIAKNGWLVGIPPSVTSYLRNYCDTLGITGLFRQLLFDRPISINDYEIEKLVGLKGNVEEWYFQRPSKRWSSNMHWISPWNEVARLSYLEALGKGGFSTVLDSAGYWFHLDNLTCFHNSFIGVSECDDSYLHTDFDETGRKSFNFVFPLKVVQGSAPELDILSDDYNVLLSVNYEYDVAVTVGDWTWHKTAAINYTGMEKDKFRMMASVYCSEIDHQNINSIRQTYGIEDPAPFYGQFDNPEVHWGCGRDNCWVPP